MTPSAPSPRTWAVVIGRNEGARLVRSLASLSGRVAGIVYVDSGSTDGSLEAAAAAGASVVRLDLSTPFTAARARNAGFAAVSSLDPGVEHVQFIDGDCELDPAWIDAAGAFLAGHPDFAIAAGRRRERAPSASVYNRLCDAEWNTAPGEAASCGGDILARAAAVTQVGGYNPALMAGEEPEMCARLRAAGWRIMRLDLPMTLHDAAILRFPQWWRRTVRTGYGYAEGALRRSSTPDRSYLRQCLSSLAWAVAIPLVALALTVKAWPLGAAAWGVYPAQWCGLRLRAARSGRAAGHPGVYAFFLLVSKFATTQGIAVFLLGRLLGKTTRPIEYKGAAPAAGSGPGFGGGS